MGRIADRRNARLARSRTRSKSVRPNFPRHIMQTIPKFATAATNLRNYGVAEEDLHEIVDAVYGDDDIVEEDEDGGIIQE